MTCIVGFADKNRVWIGGDSAGVSGWSLCVRADQKVFRNGEFLFGFTSSFRMGQLLRHALKPPQQKVADNIHFLSTDFINAVRECLKDGGFARRTNESEEGGDFLLGYRGGLYHIASDYQVAVPSTPYCAVGCGADIALGAMFALRDPPRQRVRKALSASERHCAGVRGPFTIMSIRNEKVTSR